jgi:hypothetical protein
MDHPRHDQPRRMHQQPRAGALFHAAAIQIVRHLRALAGQAGYLRLATDGVGYFPGTMVKPRISRIKGTED